jgi:hypothetical protein
MNPTAIALLSLQSTVRATCQVGADFMNDQVKIQIATKHRHALAFIQALIYVHADVIENQRLCRALPPYLEHMTMTQLVQCSLPKTLHV